jgi:hypothetical protein
MTEAEIVRLNTPFAGKRDELPPTVRLTEAELAEAGGSALLIEATVAACVKPNLPRDEAEALACEIVETLKDIRPTTKREAMIAAQMVVTHWAALENFRRAQTAQHPQMAAIFFGHASRLSKAHAQLSEC